jgi:hypothetical protein
VLSCEKGEITVLNDGAELIIRHNQNSAYPIFEKLEINNINKEYGTLAPLKLLHKCLQKNTEAINENKCIKQDIINAQWMMFAAIISGKDNNRKVYFNEELEEIIVWAKTNDRYA